MTKLHIPPEAITTLQNTDFFSFKRQFTKELIAYLGEMITQLKADPLVQAFTYPAGTDATVGKITKGENYRGLPYVIADFPRLFSPESVMAYRVMFWWGHYFSCTWHFSGAALQQYYPLIKSNWVALQQEEALVAVEGDEWQHALEPPVYQPIQSTALSAAPPSFLKIAVPVPFEAHENWSAVAMAWARTMLTVLQD